MGNGTAQRITFFEVRLQLFRADLHVHTLLSPCAEIEMIPPLIVQYAQRAGLDMIAITDHNASANISAVQKAAHGSGLVVLPGMEVQTREEVHVLCLFDHMEQVEAWQVVVDKALPSLINDIEFFGEQFIVDETGEFLNREERLLITSTSLSIEAVFAGVSELGGLAVPAHVNRQAFGLVANLGMVPEGLPIEALEISRHIRPEQVPIVYPQLCGYPLLQNGDVHRLDEFLCANHFSIEHRTLAEIRLALCGAESRSLSISHISHP